MGKRFFLLLLLLAMLSGTGIGRLPALAQTPAPLTATVNPSYLTTDEYVTLTISAIGNLYDYPQLPEIDGLEFVSSSQSSSTIISNGVVSSSTTFSYIYRPYLAGELIIPPITAIIDGQNYSTEPLTIQVVQGAQAVATPVPFAVPTDLDGQEYYVESSVDTTTPYRGQQLLYFFRFYQSVEVFGDLSYSQPEFVGFWHEQESQQTQELREVGGVIYRVTQLQTPLFGTSVGEQEIGRSKLTFGDVTLESEPIQVTVRPLPQPEPEAFKGAVGQFELVAELDKNQVQVGDVVTLRLLLNGTGNIAALPNPNWPALPNWRVADGETSMNTRFENGVLRGSRLYERSLTPLEAGLIELPPIAYTYFDPVSEQYQTASTSPLQIEVVPAPIGENNVVGSAEETPEKRPSLRPLTLDRAHRPLWSRSWVWFVASAPLLLLGIDWWRTGQPVRRRQTHTTPYQRAQQALQIAQSKTQLAASGERILWRYLQEQFGQEMSGMTHQERGSALAEAGCSAEIIGRMEQTLHQLEQHRFASNQENEESLFTEIEQLIADLEGVR